MAVTTTYVGYEARLRESTASNTMSRREGLGEPDRGALSSEQEEKLRQFKVDFIIIRSVVVVVVVVVVVIVGVKKCIPNTTNEDS